MIFTPQKSCSSKMPHSSSVLLFICLVAANLVQFGTCSLETAKKDTLQLVQVVRFPLCISSGISNQQIPHQTTYVIPPDQFFSPIFLFLSTDISSRGPGSHLHLPKWSILWYLYLLAWGTSSANQRKSSWHFVPHFFRTFQKTNFVRVPPAFIFCGSQLMNR